MSEPKEVTNCDKCNKPIAAAMEGEALCCRCRYGQMVESEGEHVRDAFEVMRRNDATFLSAGGQWAMGTTGWED